MKEKFYFYELSEMAKLKAAKDYRDGWNETHQEKYSLALCLELCEDLNDEILYNIKGGIVCHEMN